MNKQYKILYLCADLLDFDGTRGDMLYFLSRLKAYGISYVYEEHKVGTFIDVNDFDFVYAGVCPQKYEKLYLQHLKEDVRGLAQYIISGKVMLAVEQSFLFLGEELMRDGKNVNLCRILPLTIKQLDHYMIGNILTKTEQKDFTSKLNGFINTRYYFDLGENDEIQPLGKIHLGIDLLWKRGFEGIRYHNFFGTQLRGPILPRNYDFADYLIRLMTKRTTLPLIDSKIEGEAKAQLTKDCEKFIESGEQKKTYNYVS